MCGIEEILFMNKFFCLIALILSLVFQCSEAETVKFQSILTPEQAKQDIEQWVTFLEKTHPDLSYTIEDVNGFYQKVDALKNSITKPITVNEFWLKMMTFNSEMRDGHLSITPQNLHDIARDYISSGNRLMPFNVIFKDDKLLIMSQLNGEASNLVGYEILTINGKPVEQIVDALLKLTHGDSLAHQKAILAKRFSI